MSKKDLFFNHPISKKEMSVKLRPGITKKEVYKILDRIFELNGCTNCGFNGFDFNFIGPDIIEHQFQDIEFIEKIDVRNLMDVRPVDFHEGLSGVEKNLNR